MPSLDLENLISHLESLEENMKDVWSKTKNYDLLFQIDEMVQHIQAILKTLRYINERTLQIRDDVQ